MYRLRKIAHFARGKVLDIGFAHYPNPYLRGEIYGFDRERVPVPSNYKTAFFDEVTNLRDIGEKFDTVIAGELIEHLENPLQFLADCYHILNPGGQLVLSTPNPYYPPLVWLERFMIRRFFYAEEHLFVFLPRFLVRLMERQGFEGTRTYSGGIVVPILNLSLPFPRAFCYAVIYVGRKS
jgi:SAM-dependent methyltransferase